jgi:hypothetical protein
MEGRVKVMGRKGEEEEERQGKGKGWDAKWKGKGKGCGRKWKGKDRAKVSKKSEESRMRSAFVTRYK